MKRYELIESTDQDNFIRAVQSHLNSGWSLVGGVSTVLIETVGFVPNKIRYTQAIYKEQA